MAQAVARAIAANQIALIEAGTGIGKTLSYLLPALMSRKKTLVSTGLKNLQDQIHKKDLVLIERYFGGGFTSALVKGRENYLCLRKYRRKLKREDLLKLSGQKSDTALLEKWIKTTDEGDLATVPNEIAQYVYKLDLSCQKDLCKGASCPHNADCFYQRNRRLAQAADIILVNHHLFIADMAIREEGGKVLPDWEVAIFDEAHLLEDVATSWFGLALETRELEKAAQAAASFFEKNGDPYKSSELALTFQHVQEELPSLLSQHHSEDFLYPSDRSRGARNNDIRGCLGSVAEMAEALKVRIPSSTSEDPDELDESDLLKNRLADIASAASVLSRADDPDYVYQVERSLRGHLTLSALPIEVGRAFGDRLVLTGKPVVMTSATLSAGGDFSYLERRLGLAGDDSNVATLSIDSPYDYQNRTMLYVPKPFPDPNNAEFQKRFEAEVLKILHLSKGRALILFTSIKVLQSTACAFRKMKLPFTLLVQEEGVDRARLLADFASDMSSVLLGTASFWQGVDVPGPSLSAVIIDRLPFPRPNSPLNSARQEAIEREGGNPFSELMLPEMVLKLRQGVGRLIRASSDRGLLAIMDTRILTKNYSKRVLRMLPPSELTSDLAVAAKFMKDV